jgi:hypothetical protein
LPSWKCFYMQELFLINYFKRILIEDNSIQIIVSP